MAPLRDNQGRFLRSSSEVKFEEFGVWFDHKGYACIWRDGKSVKVHVLVWERIHGPKPPGTELHHIDHDKGNYTIGNLELLTNSDHQRLHAGWIRENGEWTCKPCTKCKRVLALDQFYPRRGFAPHSLCKPCLNVVTTERNRQIPEKRRIYNQRWYAKKFGKEAMPNDA